MANRARFTLPRLTWTLIFASGAIVADPDPQGDKFSRWTTIVSSSGCNAVTSMSLGASNSIAGVAAVRNSFQVR